MACLTRYLNRSSSEPLSNKSRLRNNPFPTLPLRLPSLQNLEHLLLSHSPDLWQWNTEPRSSLLPFLFNHTGELLCVFLLRTVEQVRWHSSITGSIRLRLFDISLLVLLDLFLHLDFGDMSFAVM